MIDENVVIERTKYHVFLGWLKNTLFSQELKKWVKFFPKISLEDENGAEAKMFKQVTQAI